MSIPALTSTGTCISRHNGSCSPGTIPQVWDQGSQRLRDLLPQLGGVRVGTAFRLWALCATCKCREALTLQGSPYR